MSACKNTCKDAYRGNDEKEEEHIEWQYASLFLSVHVGEGGICNFSYSKDGEIFTGIGEPFTAVPGRWIGAKVGLFCLKPVARERSGYADFDWFRVE